MRQSLIFALVVFLLLVSSTVVEAAKPRVRKSTSSRKSVGIAYSSVKLSRPTNSIKLTLLNLDKVNKVDYLLSYAANDKQEGAGGSIAGGGTTDNRDLYFGTCSKGVCTPHRNIKNATLLVTTHLQSGIVHTKRYRIKI